MSRHSNKLDIRTAARRARIDSRRIAKFHRDNPGAARRCREVHRNPSVLCCIFDKSVAFRIGRRSIKSIKGWPKGYKSASRARAHRLFESTPKYRRGPCSRETEIEMAARYFLMRSPDRVRTVTDPSDRAESEELDRLKRTLKCLVAKSRGEYINLSVAEIIVAVDGVQAVPGTRKADMAFTYRGSPVLHISHKMGSRPGDFRQYGGFVVDMGLRDRKDFDLLPEKNEVRCFRKDVEIACQRLGLRRNRNGLLDFSGLRPGAVFARTFRRLESRECMSAVFGHAFESATGGPDCVDVLIDGSIELFELGGDTYELRGGFHLVAHPRIGYGKPNLPAPYSPTMLVMRSPSKSLHQAGFANCRAVVWPLNRWAGRGIDQLEAVLSAGPAELKRLRKRFVT